VIDHVKIKFEINSQRTGMSSFVGAYLCD
jgi:hypothetical protein